MSNLHKILKWLTQELFIINDAQGLSAKAADDAHTSTYSATTINSVDDKIFSS